MSHFIETVNRILGLSEEVTLNVWHLHEFKSEKKTCGIETGILDKCPEVRNGLE